MLLTPEWKRGLIILMKVQKKSQKEALYRAEIEPQVKKIVEICAINRIPLFFIAALDTKQAAPQVERETIVAFNARRDLTDDKIISLVRVADKGWTAMPVGMPEAPIEDGSEAEELPL